MNPLFDSEDYPIARRRARELTGKTVLLYLLGFFGIVSAVNAVMIREAISTFGGLETESSYKAGLAFAREEAAALAQSERRWNVFARVEPSRDSNIRINVRATDSAGQPLSGYTTSIRLAHPTDARLDHHVELAASGPGLYRAELHADSGQWDLIIEMAKGDERLFRSRQRISISPEPSR